MKYLLIILSVSVSVLSCFLVINSKNSDNIIKVVEEQIQCSLKPLIDIQISKLANRTSRYSGYYAYFEAAVEMEEFTDTISLQSIPTNPKEAKSFVAEQQASHKMYFELLEPFFNEYEKESLWGNTDFSFNENYYHHNSKFQSLLQTIQYKNLEFRQLNSLSFLLDKTRHTGLCFDTFQFPKQEVIQLNKVSTFPIFHTDGCGGRKRNIIYKIWVNDSLVYDMLKGEILINGKINLTYKGEKSHRVKIEFKENFFTPKKILEKTFDYKLSTCD